MSINKIALITGSTRGLGLEIAKVLDSLGVRVILTGRTQEQLNQARDILSSKLNHVFYQVDLTQTPALIHFLQHIQDENLNPNILIHNVGGKVNGDEFPLTPHILNQSIHLNLSISLTINEYFIPKMIENRWGRVIHISSDASTTGQSAPGYAAAKAAVNGYVKSAARYYAKHNIMFCGVLPGIFEHAGSPWEEKKITQPHYYQKKIEQMPLGRFGQPSEIATLVADIANSQSMMCAGSLVELTGAYS